MQDLRSIRLTRKTPVPLNAAQQAALKALKNQRFEYSLPYWTTVRCKFNRSGAGPYTYTMTSNELQGFSYAVGDSEPAAAGFSGSGLVMSLAETNIQQKFETIAGEELHIRRIGVQPTAGTDGRLASLVFRNCSLVLALNGGSNRVPLGPLCLVPGGGGLNGWGPDDLGAQPIGGGRPSYSNLTNGWPVGKNMLELPEGFIWRKKSERDGQLALIIQPAPGRTISFTTQLADEAAVAQAAQIAGVRGYANPTVVNVDLLLVLAGTVTSKRSKFM